MSTRFRLAGEQARALEDDVHSQRLPRQLRRVALRNDLNVLAVNLHRTSADFHRSPEAAMGSVVLQQMGVGFCTPQVIDGDELQIVLRLALPKSTQDVPADAAEAVDGHLDRHGTTL